MKSIKKDEAGHPLYKAKVVLEPRVSRIEIGKFEYTAPTQGQRKYKSIEVQQVMLNNYFGKADRQGGTASDIQNSDINPGSIFGLFETAADAWYNERATLPFRVRYSCVTVCVPVTCRQKDFFLPRWDLRLQCVLRLKSLP